MKKRVIENADFLLKDSVWVSPKMYKKLRWFFVFIVLILFLPWQQNIQATGKVTTFLPEGRPQEIHSNIAGRVKFWRIKEGDFVKKGDTILVLNEIKTEYLDPDLLNQTETQITAKEQSVLSYSSKVDAINDQITQLENNRNLSQGKAKNKIEQEEYKLKAEQAEYNAAVSALAIAKKQLERDSLLANDKLRSTLEVENRRLKFQDALAKKLSAEAKLKVGLNAVENARIELRNVQSEYGEKLAKAESDRYSAISSQLESEAEVSKLRNSYSNYSIRNGFYIITAPQSGYVSKTQIRGINETIKEGQAVCTIVPEGAMLAVELNVKPTDVPLINVGQSVNFVFDGWPTVVFSGWPKASFGTFPGVVYGIDNMIGERGEYRVLIQADDAKKRWPAQLKVGIGARGYMQLKTVPIWYELWRILNGFPADFYVPKTDKNSKAK
ncbi:MAG: HlyD family efflux transporter periplasmic adaptor subunit [Bacteroidetes bacterium]|nr:HlyD family efflux transporter periplasmic adaptor subunit [Bacteroidota bacterium]